MAQGIELNAHAALVVAGVADELSDGVERTRTVVSKGAALAKLDEWATVEMAQGIELNAHATLVVPVSPTSCPRRRAHPHRRFQRRGACEVGRVGDG